MTEIAHAWRTIECTWWLRIIVAGLLGVCLGTSLLWIKAALTIDHRTPISIQKVETLNSPFDVGDKLVVRIWRDKVREDCPLHSSRYASDENGRALDIPDAQGFGGPKDQQYVDVFYETSALPPGSYTLHVSLMYHCPGQSFPVQQPPVAFVVSE